MSQLPPRTYHPKPSRPLEPQRKRRRQASSSAKVSARHTVRKRPPNQADIRRKRRRALGLLYALLLVEVVAIVFTSPLFAIKRTQITGMEGVTPQEQAALMQAVSLPVGVNWFRAPLDKVKENVQGLPWVREVTVTRRFPDALLVHITERKSQVNVQVGPHSYELDAVGVAVRLSRPSMRTTLPQIVLDPSYTVHLGQPLVSNGLRAAMHLFQTVTPNSPIRGAKIEVDQVDNICLNMHDGLRIWFGSPDDVDEKLRLSQRIYQRDPDVAQKFVKVNLSCPSAPACTPRPFPPITLAEGLVAP